MLAAMDSCSGLFELHQNGIASKQAQVCGLSVHVSGLKLATTITVLFTLDLYISNKQFDTSAS